MGNLPIFVKEIILSPSRVFQKIIKHKNHTPYIFYLLAFYLAYGLLSYVLIYPRPQQLTHPTPIALALKKVIDNFTTLSHAYQPVLPIILWFFSTGFTYIIARLFSKKGTFMWLLLAYGLISLVTSPLILILNAVNIRNPIPLFNLLSRIILLWSVYLNIVAISIIFEVSKIKAVVIELLVLFFLTMILLIFMALSVISSLRAY